MNDEVFDFNKFAEQSKRIISILEENEDIIQLEKQYNQKLDYTEKTLELLMKIIDKIKDVYEDKLISEKFVRSSLTALGYYLGEVMLKNGLSNRNCSWSVINNFPGWEGTFLTIIACENGQNFFPIFKIQKYFENGSVDDLKSFYKLCIDLSIN